MKRTIDRSIHISCGRQGESENADHQGPWLAGGFPSEDAKAAHGRPGRLLKGAWKPLTPQTVRVDTSTITASRMPIMYRMEAPNARRYLRRPTTLR